MLALGVLIVAVVALTVLVIIALIGLGTGIWIDNLFGKGKN